MIIIVKNMTKYKMFPLLNFVSDFLTKKKHPVLDKRFKVQHLLASFNTYKILKQYRYRYLDNILGNFKR